MQDKIDKILIKYVVNKYGFVDYSVIGEIMYLMENYQDQHDMICMDWPDEMGGNCVISWLENGKLYMKEFAYLFTSRTGVKS